MTFFWWSLFKVQEIENFDYMESKFRFIFFANKDRKFVLVAQEKVCLIIDMVIFTLYLQDVNKLDIRSGFTYYICKLESHDTVDSVPVFKLRTDGKSLISKSKVELGDEIKE